MLRSDFKGTGAWTRKGNAVVGVPANDAWVPVTHAAVAAEVCILWRLLLLYYVICTWERQAGRTLCDVRDRVLASFERLPAVTIAVG